MIQYQENMTAFAVGRRVNMEEWNTITRTFGTEDETLGFGVPAVAGVDDHTCVNLTAAGQNVLGITEASQVLPHTGDNYSQYDSVGVCEVGVIGVLLGANVTQGQAANWNLTTKAWTNAAASATVLTIPGAQFDRAGNSGDVGVIRYRRPVPSLATAGA